MSTPSWSESAFGVVHKSFNAMRGNLARVVENGVPKMKSHTMDQRVRYNYAGMRQAAGDFGRLDLDGQERILGRKLKRMSRAQVMAAGSRSRRKGRYLP